MRRMTSLRSRAGAVKGGRESVERSTELLGEEGSGRAQCRVQEGDGDAGWTRAWERGTRALTLGLTPAVLCLLVAVAMPQALAQGAPSDVQEPERQALLQLSAALTPSGSGASDFWTKAGWQPAPAPLPCNGTGWKYITCSTDSRVATIDLSSSRTGGVRLAGEVPWGNMTQLEQLQSAYIRNQDLSGSPFLLGSPGFPVLQILDFVGNKLTSFSDQITVLTALKRLRLEDNVAMAGTLPATISALSSLSVLALSRTSISGQLPDEMGSLSAMQVLWLDGTSLSGTIPDTFSALSALGNLRLGSNRLTGGLPESLPPSLLALSVENNLLLSTFPGSLLNLTKLQDLDISYNRFYGVLPAEFWSWNIRRNVSFNYFIGPVPANRSKGAIFDQNCLEAENGSSIPSQTNNQTCTDFYTNLLGLLAPPPPSPSPPSSSSSNLGLIIGVSVAAGVVVLILVGLLVWLLLFRNRRDDDDDDEEDEDYEEDEEDGERRDDDEEEDDNDDDDHRKHRD